MKIILIKIIKNMDIKVRKNIKQNYDRFKSILEKYIKSNLINLF